jgi:hypothetical protein
MIGRIPGSGKASGIRRGKDGRGRNWDSASVRRGGRFAKVEVESRYSALSFKCHAGRRSRNQTQLQRLKPTEKNFAAAGLKPGPPRIAETSTRSATKFRISSTDADRGSQEFSMRHDRLWVVGTRKSTALQFIRGRLQQDGRRKLRLSALEGPERRDSFFQLEARCSSARTNLCHLHP